MIAKIVYHCTHSVELKETCQCQADLLSLKTVHLQSCSGFVDSIMMSYSPYMQKIAFTLNACI